MGTPDFAVPTLEALVASEHEVVGVFTQPDKAVGRKQVMTPPPVKVCAEKNAIPVYQPDTLRDGRAEELIRGMNPDIVIVVAYGKLLPESILNIAKYGCVNSHASLLPRHRGASPIQWAVLSGDKVTGVTTQRMEKGLDTGDILLESKTEIGENETAGELHDRLSLLSADLVLKTVEGLEKGEITPIPQVDELSNYAPIITREMGFLKFDKPAEEIRNLIRGFNPWPASYFFLDGKRIKVWSASVGPKTDKVFGTVIESEKALVVACGEGSSLILQEIQPEGAKRMKAADYLKGHSIEVGKVLNGENLE